MKIEDIQPGQLVRHKNGVVGRVVMYWTGVTNLSDKPECILVEVKTGSVRLDDGLSSFWNGPEGFSNHERVECKKKVGSFRSPKKGFGHDFSKPEDLTPIIEIDASKSIPCEELGI